MAIFAGGIGVEFLSGHHEKFAWLRYGRDAPAHRDTVAQATVPEYGAGVNRYRNQAY